MDKELFCIRGKKDLIFRKDHKNFYVYDPIALEYYKIDEIGAEILYCISKNFSLDKIIMVLTDEYDVEYEECKKEVISYVEHNPLQYIFYTNLIQSGLYLHLSPFSKHGG